MSLTFRTTQKVPGEVCKNCNSTIKKKKDKRICVVCGAQGCVKCITFGVCVYCIENCMRYEEKTVRKGEINQRINNNNVENDNKNNINSNSIKITSLKEKNYSSFNLRRKTFNIFYFLLKLALRFPVAAAIGYIFLILIGQNNNPEIIRWFLPLTWAFFQIIGLIVFKKRKKIHKWIGKPIINCNLKIKKLMENGQIKIDQNKIYKNRKNIRDISQYKKNSCKTFLD